MSTQPIPIKPEPVAPDPKRGLVVKLCEIMAAVGYMQKKGKNTSNQNYSYIREADVVAKMRDEFASRNIFIFPHLIHHENVQMTRSYNDKNTVSYQTNIVMRWTIVDGDTGQERSCDIPGSSASPGDKGVYVAMTGSEKYLLMKGFLLPTGDDPEDDKNEPEDTKDSKAKQFVEEEVERQKAGKTPRAVPPPTKVTTLFFTMPEEHNGHKAEFTNVTAYIASNPDKREVINMALTAYGGKRTKSDTALVPEEKLLGLLEELSGKQGIDVHKLKGN